MSILFTDEDHRDPVYCIGCNAHIPRTTKEEGNGLCPLCIAKIRGESAVRLEANTMGARVQPSGLPPSNLSYSDQWAKANLNAQGAAGISCVAIIAVLVLLMLFGACNGPKNEPNQRPGETDDAWLKRLDDNPTPENTKRLNDEIDKTEESWQKEERAKDNASSSETNSRN